MSQLRKNLYHRQLRIKRNLSLVVILFGGLILTAPEFPYRGLLFQTGCKQAIILYAAIFIIWGLVHLNPIFDKYSARNYLWVIFPLGIHLIANILDFTVLHPEWASNPTYSTYPLSIIYGSYLYLVYLLEKNRNCDVGRGDE